MKKLKFHIVFYLVIFLIISYLYCLHIRSMNTFITGDHTAIIVVVNIAIVTLLILFMYIIFKQNIRLRIEKNKLSEFNELLSEKEELFRTLFKQSPYGITFGNFKNNILDANDMFVNIIGRSIDELKNMNWTDITHPEDIKKDMDYFDQFKAGEINEYTMMKRYLRSDNSAIWVNMNVARLQLLNHSDEELSHICTVEDITDKIQTQADLEESERSVAMLLSNLPGMAYRCKLDRDWTMEFVSEGCFELTGYPSESLVQNKVISFNALINGEHQDFLWKKWNEVLKNGTIFKEEYAITTASKEIKWVYEQGQGVYNEHGEIAAIEGLIIDISNQKKREDEIRYLTYHDVLTGLFNRRYFEEAKTILDEQDKYPLSVIVGDINGLKFINSAIGHQEGDGLIIQASKLLSSCCRSKDVLARTGGDELSILMPNTTYEEANQVVHLIGKLCERQQDENIENPYHLSISVGCATKYNETTKLASIIKEAEENMYRHKMLQKKSLHSSIISTMRSSLNEKSQETEEHANRLIELSKEIGINLKLSEEQLNELELLSTLHDIGKIGIRDSILNKQDTLTNDEWLEMKKHPEMGHRIAMATPELAPIADYILNHHERWDGQGYPNGKKEEEIPLLSRIITIVDSYDAMTSDRPYRKAQSIETALEEIRRNAGTQFDPYIAELFIELIRKKY